MPRKEILKGKTILLVTQQDSLRKQITRSIQHQKPYLIEAVQPQDAIFHLMAKNPDLIIYDDKMPPFQSNKLLSVLKRAKPHTRVLLIAEAGAPQRSIDVSAQGVAYTLPADANDQQIYNAVKHCLSIGSVPRVETAQT